MDEVTILHKHFWECLKNRLCYWAGMLRESVRPQVVEKFQLFVLVKKMFEKSNSRHYSSKHKCLRNKKGIREKNLESKKQWDILLMNKSKEI